MKNDFLEYICTDDISLFIEFIKRLSLLMSSMPEVILSTEYVDRLVKHFRKIKELEIEYEKKMEIIKIGDIIKEVDLMINLLQESVTNEFMKVFYEIKDALLCVQMGRKIDIEKYPNFFRHLAEDSSI